MAATISVLVVDTDPDVGDCIREYLTADGYSVEVRTDPVAALGDVRRGAYHVAVIDRVGLGTDGLDPIEQLRGIDSDIALVVLTDHPTLTAAADAIERNGAAYMHKPIAFEDFRATMEQIAERKGFNIGARRRDNPLTLEQLSRRTNLQPPDDE